MSYFKTALSLVVAGGLCACTAATEQSAEVQPQNTNVQNAAKVITPMATVKPGANVTLNSVLPKSMTSGTYQTVQLHLSEEYGAGTMAVSIEPSEGLSLFGGSSSKTFDMTQPGGHVWNVDVKADVDGVYFLNVFAEAQGQPRSFSVRLNMGQITQKMTDDAMPNIGKLTDGGKMRVLDAVETIK